MSDLPIPRKLMHQHIATLGKTGAGKSSVMRDLAEDLLDQGKRVCIIDPKGDWWGLKSSADGKSAGYPIICFGNFKEERATDVPINERSGKEVATLIATGNRPAIIGFRGWMPGAMTRFWIDFASTLFNSNEGELYVFIDEVHNFAAKGKIMDPEAGKCLHWTNRIMSEGRGLGLTFFVASQRAQKVHNDTLDCCETLIAMRVAHPAAREAIKDWIDGNGDPARGKEVLATLAQLKRGEAWVWSPENDFGPQRVQFPMFRTFDSFAPPQLQKKVSQAGWSDVNLDDVREKLATVIAEADASDPKKLRQTIAELRKELASKKASVPAPVAIADEKHDERITARATKAATAPLLKRLHEFKRIAQRSHDVMLDVSAKLVTICEAELPPEEAPAPLSLPPVKMKTVDQWPKPSPERTAPTPNNGSGSLQSSQQNILNQLAELEALGIRRPEKSQLALLCGYSNVRSKGFTEPLAELLKSGFVVYPIAGFVELTDAGRDQATKISRPMSAVALHARIGAKLGTSEARILGELIAAYPNAIPKEELSGKLGYSNVRSKGFTEPLGRMRALGIAEYPAPGTAKAADWLFF